MLVPDTVFVWKVLQKNTFLQKSFFKDCGVEFDRFFGVGEAIRKQNVAPGYIFSSPGAAKNKNSGSLPIQIATKIEVRDFP